MTLNSTVRIVCLLLNRDRMLKESFQHEKGQGCILPKLDPFSNEITQFESKVDPIKCSGETWVTCHHSQCKVAGSVIEGMSNLQCIYRDILFKNDNLYTVSAERVTVQEADVYVLKASDHVRVECAGYKRLSGSKASWSGYAVGFREVLVPTPPADREHALDVLLLVFHATSKNGFIRRLPRSYKALADMNAVVMDGYNIVGEGREAAMFPILTGNSELEMPDVRKKITQKAFIDLMPFMFYYLGEQGYRTAYFEDTARHGTFQNRFNGFRKQPTDHYLRPFLKEVESSRDEGSAEPHCVGGAPQHEIVLNVTRQFFELDSKKFCLTYFVDMAHHNFSWISTMDTSVASFLKEFKSSGLLSRTLLLVMGDHGARYGGTKNTLQRKQEERMPLLAVVLPKTAVWSHSRSHLRSNVHRLTTPFDVHSTLLQVVGLDGLRNPLRVAGSHLPRSLSLLEKIARNRTCSEAGIEPQWCSCLKYYMLNTSQPMHKRASRAAVDYINYLTAGVRNKCAVRSIILTEWVIRQRPNSRMLAYQSSLDPDGYVSKYGSPTHIPVDYLQTKIIVAPGQATYEVTMKYIKQHDRFLIHSSDVFRTNDYGKESSCIADTHPHLNGLCYCITWY